MPQTLNDRVPHSKEQKPVQSTLDMVNKFLSANMGQQQESDSEEETKELLKPTQVMKDYTCEGSECQFDITVSDDESPVKEAPNDNQDLDFTD